MDKEAKQPCAHQPKDKQNNQQNQQLSNNATKPRRGTIDFNHPGRPLNAQRSEQSSKNKQGTKTIHGTKDIGHPSRHTPHALTENTPEERHNAEEITEVIYMEEGDQDNKSTLSAKSSLNTDDIEAPDKAQNRS